MPSSGELFFALLLSVLLATAASWVLAWRYRRRMHALMSGGGGGAGGRAAPPVESAAAVPAPTPTEVRRAARRQVLAVVALSAAIATTAALLYLRLGTPELAPTAGRVGVVALVLAWPAVPILALLLRWRRRTLAAALAGWCLVVAPVVVWRQIEFRPEMVPLWLAIEIGPPLVLSSLIFLGRAPRAIAPWLAFPLFVLVASSLAGTDALAAWVDRPTPLLVAVVGTLGAVPTMVLGAVLPWLLAWGAARALGRALGLAWRRRWIGEWLVVVAGVWGFALVAKLLTMLDSVGAAAFAMLLPLGWLAPAALLLSRAARRQRPPTLLLLRVFQRDDDVQALFDRVVERWRLVGHTVLIAGTDLAERTMDADDVFAFLDRRLAERFISTPEDVPRRIAAFETRPDADGRWRVDELYCRDTTWQDALRALVDRADVVLMDLRGFQAHNAGCRFELQTLAATAREPRIVILVDARTDRDAARAATAGAPEARFCWIDVPRLDAAHRRRVLAAVFAGTAG